ncbi:hypothetical protein RFN57_00475 [Streptomyces violaceochromogenes]|uniref:Transposase n=1 Tax=Streptomyces violaceochromogenes TaxID=67377 RepID=A0ABU6LN64_9ACTN|nr:hypothetical protein [Streptomyces violaceochromogenes]MEC7050802.1 hypothetical protein [Streptomyces violaceochromogenes]GHC84832.1 hypothetical protein GCM10010309_62820 [Streptomyces violaceochromogenes]
MPNPQGCTPELLDVGAISVDSTIVRAHQHAAGARTDPPPALGSKGAKEMEHQTETPWQSLVARLVEVVLEVRASPPPAEHSGMTCRWC